MKSIKAIVTMFALHGLLFFAPLHSLSTDFFTPPLRQIRCFNRIIFVEDANGKQFVLKYPRSPNHAVNDILGAEVGKCIGVDINDVIIFPPQDLSLGSVDKFPDKIKTLHTLVPGNEVKKSHNILGYFSIKSGLSTKAKLKSIVKYKNLYKIIALDIFLNNGDRHNGNVFYDEISNLFYAIDMDAIFYKKRLVAIKTGKFIERLQDKKLSALKKAALKNLSKALHTLMTHYPPKQLCALKNSLAAQAHFEYTELEQETFYKLVEYNFKKLQRLQKLLAQLIT